MLGDPEGELQTTGSHFDAADTKDAEGLSASEDQHPRTLDFTAQQVRQIHLCLASLHVFLALQLPQCGLRLAALDNTALS